MEKGSNRIMAYVGSSVHGEVTVSQRMTHTLACTEFAFAVAALTNKGYHVTATYPYNALLSCSQHPQEDCAKVSVLTKRPTKVWEQEVW
jgi:hypothetical protein